VATLTTATTTTQVRAYPSSDSWNDVTQVNSQKWTDKTTTFGATLSTGMTTQAMRALNEWMNAGAVGTQSVLAQQSLHGVGLEVQDAAALSTAQTGTGATTNVLDRGYTSGPATITIVTTVGATPTCTYQLEGSTNGTDWTALSSADSGTPTSFDTATFDITSATTTTRIVDPAATWQYVRLTMSSNTNVTNTITAALG